MASSTGLGTTGASTQNGPFRNGRTVTIQEGEDVFGDREGLLPPSRAAKDGRSLSNAGVTFSPRGASLANLNGPPGSFSSNLKTMNNVPSQNTRPPFLSYSSRDDIHFADNKLSEQRQADFRDKINKEFKIKTGSENLLEALLAKNSKQTKDQRSKVELELNSSNRKIAELKSQLDDEIEQSKRPATPSQGRLSALFRGSPLRSPSRIEDESEVEQFDDDLETESPTYVLADILQALEVEDMQPDYYVERANNLVELFKRYPTLKYDLAWSIFGLRVQTMLLSESREVVAAGYRVTRHAIADRKSLQTIRRLHTDSLVILSLIKESKASIEREQVLKFVRAFLDVKEGVYELSNAVVRTVVAIADHYEDRLRNIALLTLTEILVKDPSLVIAAGGITPLKNALGDGSYPGSESIVSAFLYLVDSPQSRKLLTTGQELEAAFALFTDTLAVHGHEERLKVNAKAIAAMLNTWPGLFTLAKKNFVTLRSLLLSLAHPSPLARDLVLDLLFDVLHIKPPSWTSSFLAGRRLTTYGRVTNLRANPKEQRAKVENEDDYSRVNLVDHYTALTLAVLVRCGLLQALSNLIGEASDAALKRKSTLLLGEVLKLADYALPISISSKLQVLPLLMKSASLEEDQAYSVSTNLVYQIDSVNRTLHRSAMSSKGSIPPSIINPETTTLPKTIESTRIRADMDEIQFRSLLVETQVTSTVNYLKWKWDIILNIIEGPLLNPRRLDDAVKGTKFLKRLIGFYRPFKYRFSNASNTKANQRYVRIGCALLKSLLQSPEGVQYLSESKLLRQLAECLAQLDRMSGLTSASPLFASDRISETLTGGYFNMLGTLSGDPQGLIMIGRWRMINMFYRIIDLKDRDDLIQLLLGNMDFSLDSHLRVMLSKALTSCPKTIRIFSTKLLRKYATQEVPSAESQRSTSTTAYWAIRLLVTQLYDPEVEVSEVAVQILQEACNSKKYLEYVVKCRPALDHLGEIGAPLLLRFLSTSVGYQYLNGLDYITSEMDDWFLGRNEKYVILIEASLNRALSRMPSGPKSTPDELLQSQQHGIVPPHFYRELTRTSEGCELLKESGHFENFVYTIQAHWSENEDSETMLKVKGCLWAVGNIGSMELAAPFLEDSEVVGWIIKITEQSEVITMRGTAFFVLGLISRSIHGMEILAGYGWDAATNRMGQSLGCCLPQSLENLFTIPEPEVDTSVHQLPRIHKDVKLTPQNHDPIEARILVLVVDLGNTVLTKRAAGELHGIKVKKPETFSSIPLFRKIMSILEYHTFRLPVRRFIIDMFDKDVMRQIVLEDSSDDDDYDDEAESQPMTAKPIEVV